MVDSSVDTLLVSPGNSGAFEESVSRCARRHCSSAVLGRLSERRTQSNKNNLLGLSVRPGESSYMNNTSSKYNDTYSHYNFDDTFLSEDPGFFGRQIRVIKNCILYFLSFIKSYIWTIWIWIWNRLNSCGFRTKVVFVFVVILVLISSVGDDHQGNSGQPDAGEVKSISKQHSSAPVEKTLFSNEESYLDSKLVLSDDRQREVKLSLQRLQDESLDITSRVKKLETLQSQMQLEMQVMLQEVKSFKQDM